VTAISSPHPGRVAGRPPRPYAGSDCCRADRRRSANGSRRRCPVSDQTRDHEAQTTGQHDRRGSRRARQRPGTTDLLLGEGVGLMLGCRGLTSLDGLACSCTLFGGGGHLIALSSAARSAARRARPSGVLISRPSCAIGCRRRGIEGFAQSRRAARYATASAGGSALRRRRTHGTGSSLCIHRSGWRSRSRSALEIAARTGSTARFSTEPARSSAICPSQPVAGRRQSCRHRPLSRRRRRIRQSCRSPATPDRPSGGSLVHTYGDASRSRRPTKSDADPKGPTFK
jgi:hypothetical protein